LLLTCNMNAPTTLSAPLPLAELPRRRAGRVAEVDWDALAVPEARRLRELGLDEGVSVELLHQAAFGRGPIACRIGRMTVAIRRHVAGAIRVIPDAA